LGYLTAAQAAELMAANESALRKDYYKILGLERGRLTEGEIRRAWKEMMLKYQPDKVGNSDRVRLIVADIQAVLPPCNLRADHFPRHTRL